MKELQSNKMDALIIASLYRNVSRDAEVFMNLDVSGIQDNQHIKSRVLSRAKNKQKASWISVLRIAAVACLIVSTVLFVACICIPEVRESMYSAFVDWYEDYMSVHFKQNGEKESEGKDRESSAGIQKPPSIIEKRAVATYLPEGYYAKDNEVSTLFTDTFYYDEEGNMKFKLMQTILGEIDQDDLMADNEDDPVKTSYIHGYEGLLVEYSVLPGLYYLVWQDNLYQYSLYGMFDSIDELMKIAEGINVE